MVSGSLSQCAFKFLSMLWKQGAPFISTWRLSNNQECYRDNVYRFSHKWSYSSARKMMFLTPLQTFIPYCIFADSTAHLLYLSPTRTYLYSCLWASILIRGFHIYHLHFIKKHKIVCLACRTGETVTCHYLSVRTLWICMYLFHWINQLSFNLHRVNFIPEQTWFLKVTNGDPGVTGRPRPAQRTLPALPWPCPASTMVEPAEVPDDSEIMASYSTLRSVFWPKMKSNSSDTPSPTKAYLQHSRRLKQSPTSLRQRRSSLSRNSSGW